MQVFFLGEGSLVFEHEVLDSVYIRADEAHDPLVWPHIDSIVHLFTRIFDVHLPGESLVKSFLHSFRLSPANLVKLTYDQLRLHVLFLLEKVFFEVRILFFLLKLDHILCYILVPKTNIAKIVLVVKLTKELLSIFVSLLLINDIAKSCVNDEYHAFSLDVMMA